MFCLELAKISSLVFLVLFKDRTQAGSRLSSLGGLWSMWSLMLWSYAVVCVIIQQNSGEKSVSWEYRSVLIKRGATIVGRGLSVKQQLFCDSSSQQTYKLFA